MKSKPHVDISVNPMGSLPIYSSTRGYDSGATEVASELNGMHISEMPLLLLAAAKQRERDLPCLGCKPRGPAAPIRPEATMPSAWLATCSRCAS